MRPNQLLQFISLHRGKAIVLIAGALLFAWISTRGFAPGALDSSASAPEANPVQHDVAQAGVLPEVQGPSVRTSAQQQDAPLDDGQRLDADPSIAESRGVDRVWELVERMRSLAENPATFHAEALPVIEDLTGACKARRLVLVRDARSPDTTPSDGGAPRASNDSLGVVPELMARVVLVESESPLVRGAVLLAVSTLLNEGEFVAQMAALFDLATETPSELLRACVLGAALRGEEAYCKSPLDLAYLSGLQTSRNSGLPKLYPLRVQSLMRAQEAAIVSTWIDWNAGRFADIAQEQEEKSGGPATLDAAQVGELFVTSELLFSLWGQRALIDVDKEDRLIVECSRDATSKDQGDLIYFRAAQFVAHSLALCNDRLFDLAVKLGASEDRVTANIAGSMQGLIADDLGVALLSKLERLRYSIEPGDAGLLELALLEVGETLSTVKDAQALEKASSYLSELVQDQGLDEMTRTMALHAIVTSGSWPSITKSAKAVFTAHSPDTLYAQSLTALVTHAGSDPQRRKDVVQLFTETKSGITTPWVLDEFNAYIEQWSK